MKKLMFLTAVIVGLCAASAINAQTIRSYKFNGSTLQAGTSLQPGQGLMSPGKTRAFVLQQDGNLCLYKLEKNNVETAVKCTMTIEGSNKGARLDMQKDGNLVLYNADGTALWSTDTYQGDNSKTGAWIWMSDIEGKSVQMTAKDRKSYIWNFEG